MPQGPQDRPQGLASGIGLGDRPQVSADTPRVAADPIRANIELAGIWLSAVRPNIRWQAVEHSTERSVERSMDRRGRTDLDDVINDGANRQ